MTNSIIKPIQYFGDTAKIAEPASDNNHENSFGGEPPPARRGADQEWLVEPKVSLPPAAGRRLVVAPAF